MNKSLDITILISVLIEVYFIIQSIAASTALFTRQVDYVTTLCIIMYY